MSVLLSDFCGGEATVRARPVEEAGLCEAAVHGGGFLGSFGLQPKRDRTSIAPLSTPILWAEYQPPRCIATDCQRDIAIGVG